MDTTTIKGQVLYSIIGDIGIVLFIASFFWMSVGVLTSFLMNIAFRDPTKPGTPIEFSTKVFFQQNIVRILLNILVMVAVIVFYNNLYHDQLNTFWAWLAGLTLDQIIIGFDKLRKKAKKVNL